MNIELKNGSIYGIENFFSEIIQTGMIDVFQHAKLCKDYIDHSYCNLDDVELKKIMLNFKIRSLYINKFSIINLVSAIKHLNSFCDHPYMVKKVYLDEKVDDFFIKRLHDIGVAVFFEREVFFLKLKKSLFNIKFKGRMIARYIVHLLFYTFFLLSFSKRRKNKNRVVLRSWVDIVFEIFGDDSLYDSMVLVYPFALKLKRQLLYISALKKKGIAYSLCGYRYSLLRLLKWLFTSSELDLARLEREAASSHASLLINKLHPINILSCSDEFEIASFVLNAYFIRNGLEVFNSAHGIGRYSPYICYSKFEVFNRIQYDYYHYFNPSIEIVIKNKFEQYVVPPKINYLVFLSGVSGDDNSILLLTELKMVKKLVVLASKYDLIARVKLHPNTVDNLLVKKYSAPCFFNDDDIMSSAIFFSMYSTAYYTFSQYGPTYLIRDLFMDPALAFGKDARILGIEDIEKAIVEHIGYNS